MANSNFMVSQNQDFIRMQHDSNIVLVDGTYGNMGLRETISQAHKTESDLAQQPTYHKLEESRFCLAQAIYPLAHEDHNDDRAHDDQFLQNAWKQKFGLSDNHVMALLENQDSSSQDMAQQDEEMSNVPSPVMFPQEQQLAVDTPLLESRSYDLVPVNELTVGKEFPDVHSCRRALRDAAIAHLYEMQIIKSDRTRFTAKCASEGCPWRIHAAKISGVPTFTIRTIHGKHTCGGPTHLGHQQASVQWVADVVAERLKENPNCKPKEIVEEIHRIHGITLSYKQAWRGKERIMERFRGSYEEDYRLLPKYCDLIRRTNPGSIAVVQGNSIDNCFQRLFVSLCASIQGFLNGCQPLIGLDKTPLKNKYPCTLIVAAGFDGDGKVFPLAFGVVDNETDDNWMWFLSELHNLFEINANNMPKLTILSNRQKGIIEGVEANFPTAFHGFCMQHLSNSFEKEFNNSMLTNLLWDAAQAPTAVEFEQKILEVEEASPEAAAWIRNIPSHLWASAFFEGKRLGQLTANIVDSLSPWLSESSGLPIIQMMECTCWQLMTLFNERFESSLQWSGMLTPSAERLISMSIAQATAYQVSKASEAEFEVISHEGTFRVDIRKRSCWCEGWEILGLPCSHSAAALLSCSQSVNRFTETYFTVATYRKAYSHEIHPVPDKSLWKEVSGLFQNEGDRDIEVVIKPPALVQQTRQTRRKRARLEDAGRGKRIVHCSRCKQTGHFRTTCTAPP